MFVFKDAGLQPYLDQINIIEEQVAALEQAAYKLDAYSKKLGNHFYLSWFDKSTLLPVWPYIMIVNIYGMPILICFNLHKTSGEYLFMTSSNKVTFPECLIIYQALFLIFCAYYFFYPLISEASTWFLAPFYWRWSCGWRSYNWLKDSRVAQWKCFRTQS